MGCTIPGCGSSGHNRRTHDKHVPPGEPLDPTRFLVGERGPSSVVGKEEDRPGTGLYDQIKASLSHGPDAGQSVVQAATSGDQDPITADDIRAIPGVDHECEPAPGQVYFCRHCGEDLMVPLAGAPEPVTGSGLDEFAPEVVEAVSRIADEMDAPHGPGCTLADPCDECRRNVAAMAVDPERTIREQMGRTEDVFMCHHERCGHIDEEDCSQECDDADHEYAERHSDDVDPYPEQCEHIRCDHHEEAECGTDCADLVPPWRTVLGPDEPILITLPGVYELTSEQYHSFEVTGDWFSNSDAKKLLQTCPAQFDYDRRNGVKKISDAFDFGHVAHAVVLGDGERYEVFEPRRIDRRTKEGQAQQKAVDEARAAGRTPIYGDQFALIEAMAEAIKADPVPRELLTQPGRPEVCLFWHEQIKVTDPHNSLYGQTVQVKRRAMIDHLPDLTEDGKAVRIVDYKTADEVKPDDSLRKKVYDYGYHRQSATYEAAVECLFGRSADVVFLLQSKKPPHLIVPVEMDTPAVRVAVAENNQAMALWAECVATGEWPGYVSGIAVSGVPAWIERQFEEDAVIN